jgi:hypothetical protein
MCRYLDSFWGQGLCCTVDGLRGTNHSTREQSTLLKQQETFLMLRLKGALHESEERETLLSGQP